MATELDAFVRHQVYVEGYKNGEARAAEASFEEITAVVLLMLTKLGYNNLSELPKSALARFSRDLNKRVKEIFNKNAEVTMSNIRDFMVADLEVTRELMSSLQGKPLSTSLVNVDRLWTNTVNQPIAGVGVEPSAIMASVGASIAADIVKAVKMGYADSNTIAELIAALVGTRGSNFRDGLFTRLKRQLGTAVQTTIQHTSAMVQFKLGGMFYENYTWISILDSRTSSICRERNGRTFSYRDGPRPPAHWNCRSMIVPVTVVKLEDLPTFYTWIKRQPVTVQNDVLGAARGRELRTGFLKSDDLPGFDGARPLTVKEYRDKLSQMLSEVA